MNRRQFLKLGGFSTLSLAFGSIAFRVGGAWWDQDPGADLQVLSGEEAEILVAIADTMFPGEPFGGGMPSASQTGIVEFFDDYLTTIDELPQQLLRVLLHAVDDVAVLADFGATRFRYRPRAEREEILRAWDRSWLSARRGAYSGLKILIAMGYTENAAVIAAAGWDYGCLPTPDAKPPRELAHGGLL